MLKARAGSIRLAVVDNDPLAVRNLVGPVEPFYTDVAEALEREQPDLLINVTPPGVHNRVNHLAFDHRIPVLCEKPIADEYSAAVEIVNRAVLEDIPFMIAENYRRSPAFRRARRLIASGKIGQIAAVHAQFFKERYFEKAYLLAMPDPLLQDVTVHHFDLVRFLTGSEGRRILAHAYRPAGTSYPGNAGLNFWLELESGAQVTYAGSLSAKGCETGWLGEWRIEGLQGVLRVNEEAVHLDLDERTQTWTDFHEDDSGGPLDEFLAALSEGREPESSGADYLNTQRLVHFAQQSSRQSAWLEIR
jgi:predicted dehydrogenase